MIILAKVKRAAQVKCKFHDSVAFCRCFTNTNTKHSKPGRRARRQSRLLWEANLLELKLLDVLPKTLLKDSEDLLSATLAPIHSLAKGLLKLAAQAEDEVHHAPPACHWGAPHAAQLLLQPGNT